MAYSPRKKSTVSHPGSGVGPTIPTKQFAPSAAQLDVADWVKGGEGNAIIEAKAGSGKTTTLVYLTGFMRGSIALLAFNRAIADEIAHRVKNHPEVDANTFHSFGLRAWSGYCAIIGKPRPKIEAYSKTKQMHEALQTPDDMCEAVGKLVSFGKQDLYSADLDAGEAVEDIYFWTRIIEHYSILDYVERDGTPETLTVALVELARRGMVWARAAGTTLVDFDDMMWLPLTTPGVRFPKYDWVLVDEAQDTSLARRLMATELLSPSGRMVIVGDEFQSIYGFAGATPDSMGILAREFNCAAFPLNVTYRCSHAATKYAQQWVPDIIAHEANAAGSVTTTTLDDLRVAEFVPVHPGDAILCRNTKPVVSLAFELLRKGIACHVEGRDIGKAIIALVNKWKVDTCAALRMNLENYRNREIAKMEKNYSNPEYAIEALNDRIDAVLAIAEDCETTSELRAKAAAMFRDTVPGETDHRITLSTIHKCVHPDTLLETPGGFMRIRDIDEIGKLATPTGVRNYKNKVELPAGPALQITTERGYAITVTPEHGLTCWDGNRHTRVTADKLEKGSWLRLKLGSITGPTRMVELPAVTGGDIREVRHQTPQFLTSNVAEFLGLMVADGTVYKRGFRLTKRHKSVVTAFSSLCRKLFKVETKIGMLGATATPYAEVSSTHLARWLNSIGGLSPNQKRVPDMVLRSPDFIQRAFLRGLFEDGSVNNQGDVVDHIHWENRDFEVVGVVQTMLLRLGIVSSRRYHHQIGSLYIYGQAAKLFAKLIGFTSPEKNARCAKKLYGRDLHTLIPISRRELIVYESTMKNTDKHNARARGYISRHLALGLDKKVVGVLRQRLAWLYDRIQIITPTKCSSMCVEVPKGSRFLQNGFDGWNSKGREWANVFLLGKNKYMPSRYAKKDYELAQERNLLYVASTRAKVNLTLVNV